MDFGQEVISLLDLLGDPQAHLLSAEETLSLDEIEITRRVTLKLQASGKARHMVVDLLRPKKGHSPHLEIEKSSHVSRRVGHEEHFAVASDLISLRFQRLWRTVKFPEDGREDSREARDFGGEMIKCLRDLIQIPRLSVDEGNSIFDKHWTLHSIGDNDPGYLVLKPLLDHGEILVDLISLQSLAALCRMFIDRYLCLVDLSTPSDSPEIVEVVYQYRNIVKDSPNDERALGKEKWFRAAIRHSLGELPPAVRIHVPLAKKALEYRAEVDAPGTFFFYRSALLRHATNEDPSAKVPKYELADADWSTTIQHGRRSLTFVRRARTSQQRLYVSVDMMAYPSQSLIRTLTYCLFNLLMFLIFSMYATFSHSYNSTAGTLTVAILSLMYGVVRDDLKGSGVFAPPLQSRLVSLGASLLVALFAIWLLTFHGTVNQKSFEFNRLWFTGIWHDWGDAGIILMMGGLTAVSARRLGQTISRYRHVMSGKADRNHLYNNRME